MNIYLRKVASEGINHYVEHCIFVPASRVLFSSRCLTFRVSLLSSIFILPFVELGPVIWVVKAEVLGFMESKSCKWNIGTKSFMPQPVVY